MAGVSDSSGTNGFLILRYLPNGILDNSFGINGKKVVSFGYNYQEAHGVIIQPDGKIVVTGHGSDGLINSDYDILTVRLKSTGEIDSSFGNNGKVITDFGKDENANTICLQTNNKIVIGGSYNNSDFLTLRLKANGVLDSTYGTNGKVISNLGDLSYITSVAIQSNGKIIAGGTRGTGNSVFAIARYNTNGTKDTTFGSQGFVYTDYGNNSDQVSKVVVQPDQKIVAVGGTGLYYDTKHEYIAVARYKTNGSLDSNFGTNGKSTLQYPNFRAFANDIVLQTDNKLVVTGVLTSDTNQDYILTRLKTNGNFDSSFGTNGTTITDFGSLSDVAYGVKLQGGDSSIIVAGTSQSFFTADTIDVSVAAYNQSGIQQKIISKIRHWMQHHNGIIWDANNNIRSYTVQRSYDGVHFSSIARINSNNNAALTYEDPTPLSGNNYYRLQTTSINGAINYSNVLAVSNNDIKISPNPATNNLQIQGLPSNQKTELTIVDITGNIKLQAVANASSYNLNITSLKQGNYLLKIEMNGEVVTKQFVKE
ncbi:MAG: T9SS type A sorting domain-containing protein [Parafilimonas sp.]|nr:T9SS type A sorting domain-containing protein [Parafilimonas sp.]